MEEFVKEIVGLTIVSVEFEEWDDDRKEAEAAILTLSNGRKLVVKEVYMGKLTFQVKDVQ